MRRIDSKYLSTLILQEIEQFKNQDDTFHPYDISEQLSSLRNINKDEYLKILKKIPHELFADVLSELPSYIQEEAGLLLSPQKLADVTSKMDTDDAADFIQHISDKDEQIAKNILSKIDNNEKEVIEQLISYDENVAGAYMQTELFNVYNDEQIGKSITRLTKLKNKDEIDHIFHAHITNKNNKYIGSIALEYLIVANWKTTYKKLIQKKDIEIHNISVNHLDSIDKVVEVVSKYNLSAIGVVDNDNKLIGRITSDDIYDIIQEKATKQIYNLAGVNNENEFEDNIFSIGKKRAYWLGVNLLTAIIASFVISLFDNTLQSFIALAILMPIVASMGGNAGTQTLTITVRQIALGEIDKENGKRTIYKEVLVSLINGFIFAIIMGIIAYFWFDIKLLWLVIGLSIVINLLFAGFFGALIPLWLKKLNIDPAIGSTVLLTTITDVIGFFSFLGLAKLILL